MRVRADRQGYILDRLWNVGEVFDWPEGVTLGKWVTPLDPHLEVPVSRPDPVVPRCGLCEAGDPPMRGMHLNSTDGTWSVPCVKYQAAGAVVPMSTDSADGGTF